MKKPAKKREVFHWFACRSRRFWVAATLAGLPMLYIASYGPVCWLDQRNLIPYGPIRFVVVLAYQPMDWLWLKGPAAVRNVLTWYGTALSP